MSAELARPFAPETVLSGAEIPMMRVDGALAQRVFRAVQRVKPVGGARAAGRVAVSRDKTGFELLLQARV